MLWFAALLAVLAALYRRFHPPWVAHLALATGIGSERTLNAAMRSKDGTRVLVYLSSPTTVFLHMEKVETRAAKATWISPVTGEKKDAGTFATGNDNGQVFPGSPTQFFKTPDFWEDAVLLLEGVER